MLRNIVGCLHSALDNMLGNDGISGNFDAYMAMKHLIGATQLYRRLTATRSHLRSPNVFNVTVGS